MFSHGDSWMKSSGGSGGAPRSSQNALNDACASPCTRSYSSQYSAQPERSWLE